MKHDKISIKWKIFAYLLGFTVAIIAILWLFQIVYLNTFYKVIKRHELNNVAKMVEKYVGNDDFQTIISNISRKYDVCINVIDTNGDSLYSAETKPGCAIHNVSKQQYSDYYAMAKAAGGSTTLDLDDKEHLGNGQNNGEVKPEQNDDIKSADNKEIEITQSDVVQNENSKVDESKPLDIGMDDNGGHFKMFNFQNNSQSVVYMNILKTDDTEKLLLINSLITPVDATVSTLRIQLTYITVITLILALLIALLISKRVSRSIIKVSDSAKKFAKGDLDVHFDGRDYREIAELSDTLNYATEELSKTENLRRELIANVSHDLRTPLTMIIAYSEVMRDLPGENIPENVQVVIDEAKRLTDLVNDMLDISKLQAGVMTLNKSIYNLTDSIIDVMERYSKLKLQDGYNITFEYTEKVKVEADEQKMHQVLYNLINNAINYTGDKKIVKVKQIVKGNIVRIEVIDCGIGIEKDKLPYIWDRYYKIDKTHKRAISGTGLGLSIVRNILELHEAKYGVNSVKDKGSTFWFEIRVIR